jgi:hypothetical protein
MDVFTAAGAALRRWYVTLPIIALSAFVGYQQFQAVEPLAEASASILVLPATAPANDEENLRARQNPLLSGGVGLARQVLVQTLNSGQVQRDFRQDGAQRPFIASTSRDSPFVTISASGPDAAAVVQTVDTVAAGANDVLRDLQLDLGAQDAGLFRTVQPFPPGGASLIQPERNRTLIALLVGGSALAVVTAVLVDNLLSVRASRRGRRRLGAGGDPKADEVESSSTVSAEGRRGQRLGAVPGQTAVPRRAREELEPDVVAPSGRRQPREVDRDSA